MKIGRIATGVNDGLYTNTLINVSFVKRIRYAHTFRLLYETYTVLCAVLRERWGKGVSAVCAWLLPEALVQRSNIAHNSSLYVINLFVNV